MKDRLTMKLIFGTGVLIVLLFIATMILGRVQENLTLRVSAVTEARNKIITSSSSIADKIMFAAVAEEADDLKDIQDIIDQQTVSLSEYLDLLSGTSVEDQIAEAVSLDEEMSVIEEKAVEEISEENWSSALDLMKSKDYLTAKRQFTNDIVDTIDSISQYFAKKLSHYVLTINIMNIAKLIASFQLILICIIFFFRAKKAVFVQKKLAAKVEEANALLEHRIEERTRELSVAFSEASSNKEKLQLIINSTSEGIYGADIEGKITFCNHAIMDMLNIKNKEQLIGKSGHECIHQYFEQTGDECLVCSTVKNGDIFSQEFVPWIVAGSNVKWVKVTANPIYQDGAQEGSVFTIVDVTAQHEINEALAKAKEAADNANQLKSDFLANMSHEIRTPMNAILGMCHLTLRTELQDKQRNYIEKVQFSAQSLLEIINDILDFSKIEAGKLQMEKGRFVLEDVILHATDLVAVKAQEKNIELRIEYKSDFSHEMWGDKLRLGQVITNLLSNAVKFTEAGSITLSVDQVEQAGEKVKLKFSVCDTGIGLTKDQQDKLFQAFTQADTSTTRKYGGTGLGLAISKSIVTLMNGDIGVESIYGTGSTFWFTAEFIRYEKESSNRSSNDKDKNERLGNLMNLKILVVDDNEASREMMTNTLESFRFDVRLAASGVEALEALKKEEALQPFDLVILDYLMPDMDGVEVFEQIKASKKEYQPKAIMLTAYGREDIRKRADKAGIDGFLVKPVNTSVLLDMIMHVMNQELKIIDFKKEREGLKLDLSILNKSKVLLVEDNEVNQELALDILNESGMLVTVAENGKQALEAMSRQEFDLVLMDCQMPVMDGYEATEQIRKDPQYEKLPIIAMTANAIEGERDKCFTAGMNDYVSKPIDIESFLQTLCLWMPLTRQIQPEETAEGNPSLEPKRNDMAVLPEFEMIDKKAGIAYANGNSSLYRSILVKFLQGNQDFQERFEKALELQQLEEARRLAHTLKGLSGSIAAKELQAEAEKLEQFCAQNQTEQAKQQINKVQGYLEGVLSDIRKLEETIQTTREDEKEAEDSELIKQLTEQLKEYLKQDSSQAVKTYDDLMKAVSGSSKADLFKPLGRYIKAYDFEYALEVFPEQ